MFSACFNKQGERQKRHGKKSLMEPRDVKTSRECIQTARGAQQGSHLPREDKQLPALGSWPGLGSTSQSLTSAAAL